MIIGFIMLCAFIITVGFAIVLGIVRLLLYIGMKLAGKSIVNSAEWIEDKKNEYWQTEYERRLAIAENEPWVQEVIEWENNKQEIETKQNYAILEMPSGIELQYTDTYEKAYLLKRSYEQKRPGVFIMIKKMC